MADGGTIGSIALDDPIKFEDQFSSKKTVQVEKAFDGSYSVSRLVTTSNEGRYKVKVTWVTQDQMDSIKTWLEGGTSVTITSHTVAGKSASRLTSARGIPGTDSFTHVDDNEFLTHDLVKDEILDLYNGEFEVIGTLVGAT